MFSGKNSSNLSHSSTSSSSASIPAIHDQKQIWENEDEPGAPPSSQTRDTPTDYANAILCQPNENPYENNYHHDEKSDFVALEGRQLFVTFFYDEAVRKLFSGNQGFIVISKPNAEQNKDALGFRIECYDLNVYKNCDIRYIDEETPHLTVTIKLARHPELSAELGTTLSVNFKGKENWSKWLCGVEWPNYVKPDECDHASLIQALIIQKANRCYHEVAGENGNFNLYSDGFLNEKNYPKISHQDIPQAVEFEKQIFENDSPASLFAANKAKKQQLELAASLFPLSEYFELAGKKGDWRGFIIELQRQWVSQNRNSQFQAEFIENVENVNKKIEELIEFKKNSLDEMKIKYADRYSEVLVMKSLYVSELLNISHLHYKINEKKKAVEAEIDLLRANIKPREDIEGAISTWRKLLQKNPNNRMQQSLEEAERDLRYFKQDDQHRKEKIRLALKDRANLINELQEAQIKANLFTNKAYINHAAPYHLVAWQQKGEGVTLNKRQLVMGSILQQIGFLLSHAQTMLQQGLSIGEIAHKVSKYGMRVADMILGGEKLPFKNVTLTEDQWKKMTEGEWSSEIFKRLRAANRQLGGSLRQSDYELINQQIALSSLAPNTDPSQVTLMLKRSLYQYEHPSLKRDVSDDEANLVTEKALKGNFIWQMMQWLAIARNVIILTYDSRLSDKNKMTLWGGQSQVQSGKDESDVARMRP